MTQFTGGQTPLGIGLDPDLQDSVTNDDLLPSAGDASGLSAGIRQRLDSQVQSAGSADQVVATIRARIAQIDAQDVPVDDPSHTTLQAERALAVAQISYLEEHHGADPTSAFDTANSAISMAPSSSNSMMTGSTATMTSNSMGTTRRRSRTYDT